MNRAEGGMSGRRPNRGDHAYLPLVSGLDDIENGLCGS
jgi:hypothetical protein